MLKGPFRISLFIVPVGGNSILFTSPSLPPPPPLIKWVYHYYVLALECTCYSRPVTKQISNFAISQKKLVTTTLHKILETDKIILRTAISYSVLTDHMWLLRLYSCSNTCFLCMKLHGIYYLPCSFISTQTIYQVTVDFSYLEVLLGCPQLHSGLQLSGCHSYHHTRPWVHWHNSPTHVQV